MDRPKRSYLAPMSQRSQEPQGLLLIWIYVKFLIEVILLLTYTFYSYIAFVVSIFIPPQPKSLLNEIILVTGGGNGMGRELCLQLARQKPAAIISWELDEGANKLLISELKALGVRKAFGYKVDVSSREDVAAAAQKVRQEVGDVTMLFNNAGILGQLGKAWEMNPKTVEKVFQVNVMAHCWTLSEFLPSMIRKGRGHVIQTCSMIGLISGKNGSPYIGSKFAVHGYTESVKEDLRNLPERPDIKFTSVYPNVTRTGMTSRYNLKAGKYPFLVPNMEPSEVASGMIAGALINQEYIYFPSYLRILPTIMSVLPPVMARRFTDIVDMQMDL